MNLKDNENVNDSKAFKGILKKQDSKIKEKFNENFMGPRKNKTI